MDLVAAAKVIYSVRMSNADILLRDNRLGLKGEGAKPYLSEIKANEEAIKKLLEQNSQNSAPILQLFSELENANYGLSAIQKSIFAHCTKLEDNTVYNVPLVVEYKGKVAIEILESVMHGLLATHMVLRSRIDNELNLKFFHIEDFQLSYVEANEEELITWKKKCATAELPVINQQLIQFHTAYSPSNDTTYLSLTHHHIIEDVLSLGIIKETAIEFFNEPDITKVVTKHKFKVNYYDYVVYEEVSKSFLNTTDYFNSMQKHLDEVNDDFLVPINIQKEMVVGRTVKYRLSGSIGDKIKELCTKLGITEFNLLITAYALTIDKYFTQSKLAISTTISVRNQQLMSAVGPLINVLPLAFSFNDDETIATNLNRHQLNLNQLIGLSALAFDDVLARLAEEKRELIQHFAFTLHNIPSNQKIHDLNEGIGVFEDLKVKYPLSLTVENIDNNYLIHFEFSERYFSDNTATQFFDCFTNILEQIVNQPESLIAKINLLPLKLVNQLDTLLNSTVESYSLTKNSLVNLFESQVTKNPEQIALIFNAEQVSYKELNARANQLARVIRERYHHQFATELAADTTIGLCINRGIEMVVSILAILKAGAAYVPIDPNYPLDRINYILDDAKISLLVTESAIAVKYSFANSLVVLATSDQYGLQSRVNLELAIKPEDLAYIIYTSGTTGMPKGVMIEHKSVINFLLGMQKIIGDSRTWLTVTNITFDISVLEIMGSLIYGFKLVISPAIGSSSQDTELIHTAKSMDFGLFYFGNHNADGKSGDINKYDLLLKGAKYADENGFNAVWTPERHFGAFGGLYPNPVVTSAALSSITSQVKLRTGSCVLPLHHPIRVAEDWAIIDNLSNGRVELSFATGWNKNDFTIAPENFVNRREVLLEKLAIVKRLWQGEKVTFSGVDGTDVQIATLPRPIQSELPVWFTVGFNPESFRQAGENGAHILTHLLGQSVEELAERIKIYHDGLVNAGYDKSKFKIALMLHTFVSHCSEYSLSQVEAPFKRYLASSVDLLRQLKLDNVDTINDSDQEALLEFAFQKYYYSSGLFGTPQSCLKMIDMLKGIGVTEIACLIDFGIREEVVLENLKHLNQLKELANQSNKESSFPADLINKYQVTHLQCTPSLAKLIFNREEQAKLSSLTTVLLGGEALPPNLMHDIHCFTNASLYNMYGPTEATIWATSANLMRGSQQITIGNGLPNISLYVLNPKLERCAIGVIGELFIGGACLARGYFHREELTSNRFINNPYYTANAKPNQSTRIYRTGDLVRILDNGQLEYIGRNDFQVKVNGHRIEIGEIEYNISLHPKIKQALVCIKQRDTNLDTMSYIAAYYIADEYIGDDELNSFLSNNLPEYMLPEVYVHIMHIPLTANGKVDYRSLPDPTSHIKLLEQYVAPRNQLEESLCSVWCELLKLERVSINDNFFKIGGNSILAIQAAHKMSNAMNKNITLAMLFKYKTIEQILLNMAMGNAESIPVTYMDFPTLSFSQERMWFIHKYADKDFAYNHPFILRLKNNTNKEQFKDTLLQLVERHQILRTVIRQNANGNFYQLVKSNDFIINELNLSSTQLAKFLQEMVYYNFDLEQEIPFKVWWLNLDNSDTIIALNMHHIAVDGWSLQVFFNELVKLYITADYSILAPINIQYKDFAIWQRQYLSVEKLSAQQKYWYDKLQGFAPLELYPDKSRPSQIDYYGNDIGYGLSLELSRKLRQLAKSNEVTLYTVLLTGFNLLLNQYTNQNDIVIGSPVANRHYKDIENLVGFFVNTLVIRNQIESSQTIKEFMEQVYSGLLEAQSNQDYPFEKLINDLNIAKDPSRNPIFQIVFGVQASSINIDHQEIFDFIPYTDYYKVAKFDLSLFVDDSGDQLICNVNYATSLYNVESIHLLIMRYESMLELMCQNFKTRIEDICLLTENEAKQLFLGNSQVANGLCSDVVTIFEQQVKLNPLQVALKYGDVTISYEELYTKSTQLAYQIHSLHQDTYPHDIQTGKICAIYLSSAPEMIVAMLATLMTGMAYLPLNVNDPKERIHYILEDAKVAFVITDSHRWQQLDILTDSLVVIMDKVSYENGNTYKINPLANDLAYIIYTSGTTGKPKGVMIEHKSITALATNQECMTIKSDHVFVQLGNPAFDASIFEIWGALLNGATLVLPTDSKELIGNPLLFKAFLCENKISVLWLTRTLFDNLYLLDNDLFSSLDYLLIGGEALNKKLIQQIVRQDRRPKHIINGYGPTESTVFTTFYDCDNLADNCASVPIGKPLDDRDLYVLNSNLKPLGVGMVGELHIGGKGLARGYLNNPLLTREKFIPNPLQKLSHASNYLYKTGDMVRWLSDGNLEYIGRNDFQVKIRGFRIELADIENVVMDYPEISQVTVQAVNRIDGDNVGEKYLVAYYVAERKLPDGDIYNYLAQKLPEYMLPHVFIHLDKLPVTLNGKLDVRNLPNIDNGVIAAHEKAMPISMLEQQIYQIWVGILGISTFGIDDDFFKVGGDSILSIQLSSKLRRAGYNLSVKDIFSYRTVRALASYLQVETRVTSILSEEGALSGSFGLLPIQKWFFEQNFVQANHWNQSFFIITEELELARLEESINKLLIHHDSLRLVFTANGQQQTYVNSETKILVDEINVENYTDSQLADLLTSVQSEFDLKCYPLWKIVYLKGFKDKSARIFCAFHHLIIDAVSWRILTDDLADLYSGHELAVKTTSYRQWVQVNQDYLNKINDYELTYWRKLITNQNCNYAQLTLNNESQTEYFSLSKEDTHNLLYVANQVYSTEINDLLLSTLALALNELTGYSENYITLEGHGREMLQDNVDLSRTVGWFTSMFPVSLKAYADIADTIGYIKDNLRLLPNKGIGFGVLKAYSSDSVYTEAVLPRVSFNYLGQFDSKQNGWHITTENTGINMFDIKSSNHLNIDCMVKENSLQFRLVSSYTELSSFKNYLQAEISKLLKHCMDCVSNQQFKYTMSDYVYDSAYEPLVYINPEDSDKPLLVMVHPGASGAEAYINTICPLLLAKYRIIIINNYRLYSGSQLLPDTVQEIAQHYLFLLAKLKINLTNYSIYGLSFGAIVAYEMVAHLNKFNLELPTQLFLVDPVFLNWLHFDSQNDEKALKDAYPQHSRYKPSQLPSNQVIQLIKCTRLSTFNLADHNYTALVNSICRTPYCGLDPALNEISLFNVDCDHDQTLEKPYVTAIADFMLSATTK